MVMGVSSVRVPDPFRGIRIRDLRVRISINETAINLASVPFDKPRGTVSGHLALLYDC